MNAVKVQRIALKSYLIGAGMLIKKLLNSKQCRESNRIYVLQNGKLSQEQLFSLYLSSEIELKND
jgi:hypothetical protein